jgi:hypothetical protein
MAGLIQLILARVVIKHCVIALALQIMVVVCAALVIEMQDTGKYVVDKHLNV